MKKLANVIFFGTLGLLIGYFLFARFNGQWIPVGDLLKIQESGILGKTLSVADNLIRGIADIRLKILISGGVGTGIGLLFAVLSSSSSKSNRKRRK